MCVRVYMRVCARVFINTSAHVTANGVIRLIFLENIVIF